MEAATRLARLPRRRRYGARELSLMRRIALAAVVMMLGIGVPARAGEESLRFDIAYATFLGGKRYEQAREVIPFADGSVLVGLLAKSKGLPTSVDAYQRTYAGDDPSIGHGGVYGGDCYLVRLGPGGRKVLAATYFGGSRQERNVYGMALDREGNVVITSSTRSHDLPTTKGAFQRRFGGGQIDIFAAKLSSGLDRLLWCTYLGGANDDTPRGGLTLTRDDKVTIVGSSGSTDYPTTPGVLKPSLGLGGDAIVTQLSADGSRLVFSTFLGGAKGEVVVGARTDRGGNIYLGGYTHSTDFPVTEGAAQPRSAGGADLFLAKLAPDGSRLLYSTYLGGSLHEFAEHALYLADDGTVLMPAASASPDFPTTKGAFQQAERGRDGCLAKLSADGRRVIWATVLGGTGSEFWLMPTPDASGNIFLVGATGSKDFPVTDGAIQSTFGGGRDDGALAVFSPDGKRLLYATYLGGSGKDLIRSVALGQNGEVYLVGSTESADFPATEGALQPQYGGRSDSFVVKLVPARD